MNAKDYELIAEALKVNHPEYGQDCFHQWSADVKSIADTLGKDNPRFDRRKFLEACD
jgi:hypothetical protein